MKGKLVVVEGLDCVGKSTLCLALQEALNFDEVDNVGIKFPCTQTSTGGILDSIKQGLIELDPRAEYLLFSANRWEMNKKIENLLQCGKTVIVDRYKYSGIAYAVGCLGLDFQDCTADEGLLEPDLVLFLDMQCQEIVKRSGFGTDKYEDETKINDIQQIYARLYDPDNWKIINGNKSKEEILMDALGYIKNIL